MNAFRFMSERGVYYVIDFELVVLEEPLLPIFCHAFSIIFSLNQKVVRRSNHYVILWVFSIACELKGDIPPFYRILCVFRLAFVWKTNQPG